MSSHTVFRCPRCGEVIGVYEPLVRVIGDSAHETSRAADPDLSAAGGPCYHARCYERSRSATEAG